MEDLKRYCINFRITFHCVGQKGLFRKKKYHFDFILENDNLQTIVHVDARNAQKALVRARKRIENQVNYTIQQLKDKGCLVISGNAAPDKKFRRSRKIYEIEGTNIELIKITQLVVWKEQTVKCAIENLSIEKFKSVFGETIPFDSFVQNK